MGEAAVCKRYALVTGANKGIGFEICKQLASIGDIVVLLTARDEKRGLQALHKLKNFGFSDEYVMFHQLDVSNTVSIASLANFIKTQFGKLDILVNNAGVGGAILDAHALSAELAKEGVNLINISWDKILTQSYDLAEECIAINYYGVKRTTEALIAMLQLSDSPRIVNISSTRGTLKNVEKEWAKEMLGDEEKLSIERIEEVISKYLNDYKEGLLEINDWPIYFSAYIVSKAAVNAYTRVVAKQLPSFRINCVCPGFVKTDLLCNIGISSPAEGAEHPVRLALLSNDAPSGCLFYQQNQCPF